MYDTFHPQLMPSKNEVIFYLLIYSLKSPYNIIISTQDDEKQENSHIKEAEGSKKTYF